MSLTTNIATAFVKGRFGDRVRVGADGEKLLVPARGRIEFEGLTPFSSFPTETPDPLTMLRPKGTGILDSEGYLCTPDPADPSKAGERMVLLQVPNDPDSTVQGWTWRGTPRFLNEDGTLAENSMGAFTFDLPFSDEPLDLVHVVDVPASPGLGVEQAFTLVRRAEDAATAAEGAAQAAVGAAGAAAADAYGAAADASAAADDAQAARAAADSAVGQLAAASGAAGAAAASAGGADRAAAAAQVSAADAAAAAARAATDSGDAKAAAGTAATRSAAAVETATAAQSAAAAVVARADAGEFKGAKGDIGVGWTAVPANQIHLDAAPIGVLRQFSGVYGTTANGYPFNGFAGVIQTTQWGNYQELLQEANSVPINGRVRGVYKRGYRSGAWSAWSFIPSQRVDSTAGRVIYTWDDVNNREQLLYGDTGMRDVTELVDRTKWTVSAAKLRRVNATVELTIIANPGPNVGTVLFIPTQFPVGFRNVHTLNLPTIDTAGKVVDAQVDYGFLSLKFNGVAANTAVRALLSWTTTDPWPTVLPGSAVGAVPS